MEFPVPAAERQGAGSERADAASVALTLPVRDGQRRGMAGKGGGRMADGATSWCERTQRRGQRPVLPDALAPNAFPSPPCLGSARPAPARLSCAAADIVCMRLGWRCLPCWCVPPAIVVVCRADLWEFRSACAPACGPRDSSLPRYLPAAISTPPRPVQPDSPGHSHYLPKAQRRLSPSKFACRKGILIKLDKPEIASYGAGAPGALRVDRVADLVRRLRRGRHHQVRCTTPVGRRTVDVDDADGGQRLFALKARFRADWGARCPIPCTASRARRHRQLPRVALVVSVCIDPSLSLRPAPERRLESPSPFAFLPAQYRHRPLLSRRRPISLIRTWFRGARSILIARGGRHHQVRRWGRRAGCLSAVLFRAIAAWAFWEGKLAASISAARLSLCAGIARWSGIKVCAWTYLTGEQSRERGGCEEGVIVK